MKTTSWSERHKGDNLVNKGLQKGKLAIETAIRGLSEERKRQCMPCKGTCPL